MSSASISILNEIKDYKEITVKIINSRIEKEYCYKTAQELTNEKLMNKYKECRSVKKSIDKLNCILSKYIDKEKKDIIIEEYLLELIPPGTKGVVRGNRFNKIIKDYIINLKLDEERFNVRFEENCKNYITSEIPDWYIEDKLTKKIIIGMNQLDLWGGGHQLNRGSKYLLKNKNNKNSKLLCVVCNKIQLKSKKTKVFKLFKVGFENNTLCYLNNLENIIYTYFNLK